MLKWGMLALGLLTASHVEAQIVNVQQLAGKAVAQGFSGQAALSADWLSGNSMLLATAGSASVFWRRENWVALATVSAAYGIKGSNGAYAEEPYQAKLFEHLRLRREWQDGWSIEAFGQHEYDRWRRLKTRALAGLGMRRDFQGGGRLHGAVGAAYMLQAEALLRPKVGDPVGIVREHRLSCYLTGAAQVTETTALSLTVYGQPRWDAPADLRALVDAAVQVAMAKQLGLRVSYVVGFDTRPPIGVRGFDGTSKVALTAAW